MQPLAWFLFFLALLGLAIQMMFYFLAVAMILGAVFGVVVANDRLVSIRNRRAREREELRRRADAGNQDFLNGGSGFPETEGEENHG